MVLRVALIAFLILSLHGAVSGWMLARRVWGPRVFGAAFELLRLRLRQPLTFGGLWYQLGVAMLLVPLGWMSLGWIFWATVLVVGCQFAILALPPFLIFLASSGPESQRLYAAVRWATAGQTMALARPRALDRFYQVSSWRTRDDAWVPVVQALIGLARVVVVDARHSSEFLERELCWLRACDPLPEIIYVTHDDGTSALIHGAAHARPGLAPGTWVPVSLAVRAVDAASRRLLGHPAGTG